MNKIYMAVSCYAKYPLISALYDSRNLSLPIIYLHVFDRFTKFLLTYYSKLQQMIP